MEHDLLKLDVSRDEYIRRRANHQLMVTLYTDGDYMCDMKHPKLRYCEDYVYTLCMGWEDKETAIAEDMSILTEMKKHTHSHRNWVQEDLDEFFDRAIDDIKNWGFAQRDIGGNYEGTRICFVTNESPEDSAES